MARSSASTHPCSANVKVVVATANVAATGMIIWARTQRLPTSLRMPTDRSERGEGNFVPGRLQHEAHWAR